MLFDSKLLRKDSSLLSVDEDLATKEKIKTLGFFPTSAWDVKHKQTPALSSAQFLWRQYYVGDVF